MECRIHWRSRLHARYRNLGFRMEDYPNAYGLYERELTLPLYSTLTQAQAERICGALREIL